MLGSGTSVGLPLFLPLLFPLPLGLMVVSPLSFDLVLPFPLPFRLLLLAASAGSRPGSAGDRRLGPRLSRWDDLDRLSRFRGSGLWGFSVLGIGFKWLDNKLNFKITC